MELEAFKEKYPRGREAIICVPLVDCPQCGGTGEYMDTREQAEWCGCMAIGNRSEEIRRSIVAASASILQDAKKSYRKYLEHTAMAAGKKKK